METIKENSKKIIIALLTICMIIAILSSQVMGAKVYVGGEAALESTSNLLCIARGYTTVSGNYTVNHTVKIDGTKATNGSKTATNKANAKMALIAWYASQGGNLDNANRGYSNPVTGNTGKYWNSYSQNAIWKYWSTWYKGNGTTLGINSRYNKNSTPKDNSAAKALLNVGDVYYNVLQGTTGIKIATKGSTSQVSGNYTYVGPFTITKINSDFVENIHSITIDGLTTKGYATSVGGSASQSTPVFGDKFYIVVDGSPVINASTDITVNYNVTNYIATLQFLSYPNALSTSQNLLKVAASESNKVLNKVFHISTSEEDISIQKFIVENGNSWNENGGTPGNYTRARESKHARPDFVDSESKIYNDTLTNIPDKTETPKEAGTPSQASNLNETDTTKLSSPVQITEGDYVVYKIDVYNNTKTTTTCTVKDRINATHGELIGIYDSHDGEKDIYGKQLARTTNSGEYNTESYELYNTKEIYGDNYNYYRWKSNVPAGGHNSYWVVIRYSKYFSDIVDNFAFVNDSTKSDEYRTQDLDYVKMATTNVSMQKYIVKVNDKDLTDNETDLKDRNDKKANSETTEKITSEITSPENPKKYDKPVNIEVGDWVKYAITVYNNGNKPETVEITDYIPDYVTEYYWEGEEHQTITPTTIENDNGAQAQNIENLGDEEAGESDNKNYNQAVKDGIVLEAGGSQTFYINMKFGLYKGNTILRNTAEISNTTEDNDTEYRVSDSDYVKMKDYAVSLQKIVYSVNGETSKGRTSDDKYWGNQNINTNYWESDELKSNTTLHDQKYKYPIEVEQGNTVTYAIRVQNDGQTTVNVNKIIDEIKDSNKYFGNVFWCSADVFDKNGTKRAENLNHDESKPQWCKIGWEAAEKIKIESNVKLEPGEKMVIYLNAQVKVSNLCVDVIKNAAEITEMKNKNGVVVTDTTPDNNQDADYIQLKDITIAGIVWNDKALDKKQDNYNGQFDDGKENKIDGIKVYLYRGDTKVAETTTQNGGQYSFAMNYIKGPKTSGTNRWAGTYYTPYYVVFEYDGITYTSTGYNEYTSTNNLDSNAKEDIGKVKETRSNFNNRFATINKDSGIEYDTKNETDYLPQSNHKYNDKTMAIQSSTNAIIINANTSAAVLQHINLGLRGRNIFDLELTSDVYSTKVTVNGQPGTYNYNNNKVTVRKSDIAVAEDMANFASETRDITRLEETQSIRKSDISVAETKSNYRGTGLGIEVTYKITVTNASSTPGTATKIADYYDSRYIFQRAYVGNTNLSTEVGDSGAGYKSVIITTPGTNLSQSQSMDIYVVYTLNTPESTLKSLVGDNAISRIATYNMAEIYEYRTSTGGNEATRGLIDKDSAPGSANTEKVRLTEGTSNDTTVGYYFKANELNKLKYEDDTYAAPTLYFASTDNVRTLSGVVFEDKTTVNSDKIKTGNGIQDKGEVGVYGVTVRLKEGNTVRYEVATKADGTYTFTNFLPGNYTIEYAYGNTKETVLLNQDGNGHNATSYNGEDYQATNNLGTHGAKGLNETANYWYVYNEREGVSTGKDNATRRKTVSDNVATFTSEKAVELNNVRDGKVNVLKEGSTLIADTNMYANTNKFTLTVEKTKLNGDQITQDATISDYQISNMNFGLARVPVTTINLEKQVKEFTITDSTGTNTLAKFNKDGTVGDILPGNNLYDVSIEDEKLQGARLQVTYTIKSNTTVEKNFDGTNGVQATITGLVDYIDNNLAYSEELGNNKNLWEVTTYDATQQAFKDAIALRNLGEKTENGKFGAIDSTGTNYTTIVKAKANNPVLKGGEADITLERILSSNEVSIENIITSTIYSYEYNNNVEITGINYENTKTGQTNNFTFVDRVRKETSKGSYTILPGMNEYATANAETITIHPPTGMNKNIIYYIVAAGALVILAAGVVLIKKYAIKKD